MRCIVQFAQAHQDFRLPELQSVSELYGFTISRPSKPPDECDDTGAANAYSVEYIEWDTGRPFWIIDLADEEHAKLLSKRCILIKAIYEFYACGPSYASVHEQTRRNSHLWSRYIPDTSFRFTVSGFNHNVTLAHQKEVVETFSFMDLKGKIDMKNSDLKLYCLEEYPEPRSCIPRQDAVKDLIQIYFGRLIAEGSARSLIQTFDVKKRKYFGNTSMEAEISLLMANQTLADFGKFIYDPFIGTGSMAYTAAHFGAFVFGSDIDGRQMRGKGNSPGILVAAQQYNVANRIIDLCTFDVTRNPLRCGELFDAIVTDPPYGVRAGAKRLGRKDADKRKERRKMSQELKQAIGTSSYIPPTKPYELSELVRDLVRFARYILKPGGRLVFFLPTVTDDYEEVDVEGPGVMCEGMELVANSVQGFGGWGRRLITIRKATKETFPSPFDTSQDSDVDDEQGQSKEGSHIPAHKDFREKYFKGFRKNEDGSDNDDNLQTSAT